MKNPRINYVEYELDDGECIALSTAPVLLLRLKGANKDVYQRLSKTLVNGIDEKDILSEYQLLYDAYVCANADEERMSFKEFIDRANQSYKYNNEMLEELLQPSKKQHSEQLSEEQ